ncbi:hypothetical protein RhiJN_20135 [Ceratobasidium sp. AG-Ba]|nr:hypothetical protein RhiJN_20135 [Ceratobasidium sp. AG-Ba]
MRGVLIVTDIWSGPASDPEHKYRELQLLSVSSEQPLADHVAATRRGSPINGSALDILRKMIELSPCALQLQAELAYDFQLEETELGILIDHIIIGLERQRREEEERKEILHAAGEDRTRRAQNQLERYKRDRQEEEEGLSE